MQSTKRLGIWRERMKSVRFLALALMLNILLMGCALQPEIAMDTSSYADGYQDGFAAGRAAALADIVTPTPTQTGTYVTMQAGHPTFTPKPTEQPIDLTEIALRHQRWKNQIVYITDSGDMYHTYDCSYLRDSAIEIRLADARDQGYEPCSECNPPAP